MKKSIGLMLVLVMTFCLLSACGGESTSSSSASNISNATTTEPPKEETLTPSPTEAPTPEVKETDYDILTREGHPTYYGSIEQSHKTWDDVEKGKICFANSNEKYSDATILSMGGRRNSDMIWSVSILFGNSTDFSDLSLEGALSVITTYMPYEIMDKYYEFARSELIVPDEGRQDDPSYYVITYHLTDEAKSAYYSKEHEYSGTIDVIIKTDAGQITSCEIGFGTPRWMSSLDKNSYHKEEWVCDLYDYS